MPTGTSLRRACRVTGLSTATWRYQRRPNAVNATVLARLHAHAAARPRFGYRRLHILLDREGVAVNHKRVYRVYRAAGLQVRRRRRKRLTRADRIPLPTATQRRDRWSIDFMPDTLADSRTFRVLNVVNDCTRECLAIAVDRSLPGARVVRVLERLVADRRADADRPGQRPRVCGPHARRVGVSTRRRALLIRPGKPIENAYVERFNGKFRDECLNEHWFLSMVDAQAVIEAWRIDYNTVRPHSALGGRTPDHLAQLSTGAPRSSQCLGWQALRLSFPESSQAYLSRDRRCSIRRYKNIRRSFAKLKFEDILVAKAVALIPPPQCWSFRMTILQPINDWCGPDKYGRRQAHDDEVFPGTGAGSRITDTNRTLGNPGRFTSKC